jgi:hypothetical protein
VVSFAVLALLSCAGTATSQWARQTSFDVGAIRLTRDDFADTDGVTAAALWSRWSDRVSLIGSGAATRISDGRSTGIAVGSASYAVPLHRFRFEGGGTGTILGTSDQRASSSWVGLGRVHYVGPRLGAWFGGGGGEVHHSGENLGATNGELGLWTRHGLHRLTATASATRTSTISTVIFSDQSVLRLREPAGYTDVSLLGHAAWSRLELDAVGVSRHVWKGSMASGPAASVAASWWLTPWVAVAAGVGKQLSDPMRGTDRTRYATIAIRFSAERHGPPRASVNPPVVASGETSISAVSADGGAAVIRVHAPRARKVELMSDFTGWSPVALERRGDRWEARLTAAPGSHHVMLRIDGGVWSVPANLPRIDDELGGKVGLIVIP